MPNAANDSTYYTRLLALPNGQVLFNDGSSQMLVYTAGGTPNPAWAPSVSSISSTTFTPDEQLDVGLDRAWCCFVDQFHRLEINTSRPEHSRCDRQRDRAGAGAGDDPLRSFGSGRPGGRNSLCELPSGA